MSIQVLTPTLISDRNTTGPVLQPAWEHLPSTSSRTSPRPKLRDWSRSLSTSPFPSNVPNVTQPSFYSADPTLITPMPSKPKPATGTVDRRSVGGDQERQQRRPPTPNIKAHPAKRLDGSRDERASALHASQSLVSFPIAPSRRARHTIEAVSECEAPRHRTRAGDAAGSHRLFRTFSAVSSQSLSRSKSLDDNDIQSLRSGETPYHSCCSTPSQSLVRLPTGALEEPPPLPVPRIRLPVKLPFPEAGKQDLADSHQRTWHTLMELLDTEKGYLNDLRILTLIYQEPLANAFDLTTEDMNIVARNSQALLELHETLQAEFTQVEDLVCGSSPSSGKGSNQKVRRTLSSDTAENESILARGIDLAARIFLMNARSFDIYQEYCAGHTEALEVFRRLQTSRPADWDAYERKCALSASLNLTTPSTMTTPPSSINPKTHRHHTAEEPLTIVTAPKLSCMDILIKPIQRICRYPLLLTQLKDAVARNGAGVKRRSDSDPEGLIDLALEIMKGVVSGVDEAKKTREAQVKTKLISARMDGHLILTQPLLASLGDCVLAGALDVVHHHIILAPLKPPIKARYLGAFLYAGYLILVKVRRGKTYEPRHWFPLRNAEIVDMSPTLGEAPNSIVMPQSFRISVGLHHFELAATSTAEKELWVKTVKDAQLRSLPLSPELESATSLAPIATTSTSNAKNQMSGSEDMARFLSDPFSSVGRLIPEPSTPTEVPSAQSSIPATPMTHLHSVSASTPEGSSTARASTSTVMEFRQSRRSSFFGGSDRSSAVVSPIGPSSASLVRHDSSAQHLIVDRNLSDVFSVPCLTLRASMAGSMTPQSATRTRRTTEENNPAVIPTEGTRSLSKATSKVLSRNSSVGSIFHRRSSTFGAYSAPVTSGENTPGSGSGSGSDIRIPSDRYSMPPPQFPNRVRSSPARSRMLLKSLTLLAQSSSGTDPSIVVEAEDEGGDSGFNLRTPDSGYFADGVSPTSPMFTPGYLTTSSPASPDNKSRKRKSLEQGLRGRSHSMGQNLLEFFSRNSNSMSSIRGRTEASSSATPELDPSSTIPDKHTSYCFLFGRDGQSNTPSPTETLPTFVQRGVAYVRRKRAISTSGTPVQLAPAPADRSTSGSGNSNDSSPIEYLQPDQSVCVRPKSSIVSLRAMLSAVEPHKSGSTSTLSTMASIHPDRPRVKSAPLDEQPFFSGDEKSRPKLSRKSSKNIVKRAFFQI
ncbi:hypothetical protein FRB93_007562 [Tulasnella sp. JGI-2019a]|nr:hypothetical protein FRB93_007562 [Tulasnella sp. JGI-2019a]